MSKVIRVNGKLAKVWKTTLTIRVYRGATDAKKISDVLGKSTPEYIDIDGYDGRLTYSEVLGALNSRGVKCYAEDAMVAVKTQWASYERTRPYWERVTAEVRTVAMWAGGGRKKTDGYKSQEVY